MKKIVENFRREQRLAFQDKEQIKLTKKLFQAIMTVSFFYIFIGIAEADLNNGLVAYYPLDGNPADMSAAKNNGVEYGGIDYVPGICGQAGTFGGTEDYIEVARVNLSLDDFAVSLWLKPNMGSDWNYRGAFAIHSGDLGYSQKGDKSIFSWVNSSMALLNVLSVSNGGAGEYNQFSPIDDIWSHVVFTRAGNSLETYLNGKLVDGVASTQDTFVVEDGLIHIGAPNYYGGGDGWTVNGRDTAKWRGELDEIRIYDRALPENEILQLYRPEGGNYLFFDDGEIDMSVSPWSTEPGSQIAVRFTPSSYPMKIETLLFYVAGYAKPLTEFEARVYKADNGDFPGTRLDGGGIGGTGEANTGKWVEIDVSQQDIRIAEGDFFVSMYWPTPPGSDGLNAQQIGLDKDSPIQGDACWKWGESDQWHIISDTSKPAYGNPMVRVLVNDDVAEITSIKFNDHGDEYLNEDLFIERNATGSELLIEVAAINRKEKGEGSIKFKFDRASGRSVLYHPDWAENEIGSLLDKQKDMGGGNYDELEFYDSVWETGEERNAKILVMLSEFPATCWLETSLILNGTIESSSTIKILYLNEPDVPQCDQVDVDCYEVLEKDYLKSGVVKLYMQDAGSQLDLSYGSGFLIENQNNSSDRIYLLSAAHNFYDRDAETDPEINCDSEDCPVPDNIVKQMDFNMEDTCGESGSWESNVDLVAYKPENVEMLAGQWKKQEICDPWPSCEWHWDGKGDWVLFSMDKPGPKIKYSEFKYKDSLPSEGDKLLTIHHPNGAVKKISFGTKNSEVNQMDMDIPDDFDSYYVEKGTSGAPLFDKEDLEIIGIVTQKSPAGEDCGTMGLFTQIGDIYDKIQKFVNPTFVSDDGICNGNLFCEIFIQSAINTACNNTEIRIPAGFFDEALNMEEDKTILFSSGYDETFGNIVGYSSIASFLIKKGTVKIIDGLLVIGEVDN